MSGAAFTQTPLPRNNFVGPAMRIQPEYEGAHGSSTLPVLLLNFERGLLFAGTSRSLAEAGVRLRIHRSMSIGAQLAFERGRSRKDSAFLRRHALSNIDHGTSIGPFAEASYSIGPVPVQWLVRLRQHLDQDLGAQLDFRGTCGVYGDDFLRAGLYAQLTLATGKSNQRHFGVSAQEAALGGLPEYSASGGLRHFTLGALASAKLAPRWDAIAVAEWRQALGAARDSPVVEDKLGFLATLGVIYWLE
jgi:outer membrane protein